MAVLIFESFFLSSYATGSFPQLFHSGTVIPISVLRAIQRVAFLFTTGQSCPNVISAYRDTSLLRKNGASEIVIAASRVLGDINPRHVLTPIHTRESQGLCRLE